LISLRLVHFALLEDFEGLLFYGGLARAIAHFAEALLVGGEFAIQLCELDVYAFDASVDLVVVSMNVVVGVAGSDLHSRLRRSRSALEPYSWLRRGDSCCVDYGL
jgi:hypothetical protein